MVGAHEQLVRSISAAGRPWVFADGLLAHTGGPMPQSQCRRTWGAGASQAQGNLPSLSSPPMLHSELDSHLLPLVLGSAHCGPLLTVCIHKVLLAYSHPVIDLVSGPVIDIVSGGRGEELGDQAYGLQTLKCLVSGPFQTVC